MNSFSLNRHVNKLQCHLAYKKIIKKSYYVQLQVVPQSLGALHPDQDGLLQLRAEAHCQPVCPCARPVIGGPGICDEGSSSPEDVSCPSCKITKRGWKHKLILSVRRKILIRKLSSLAKMT